MSVRIGWPGLLAVAGTALALSACASPQLPPGTNGDALDEAYGIPPNTEPPYLMRPDGLMINGLLPEQPNAGS